MPQTVSPDARRKDIKRLVILPFENMGAHSKEFDSIGEEMSISLIQSLSQVKELSVMDPTSVRKLLVEKLEFIQGSGIGDDKKLKREIEKIDEENFDLILLGNYRIIGDKIKVTLKLLERENNRVAITPISVMGSYPGQLFSVEEDIAEKAAVAIDIYNKAYVVDFKNFYAFTTNRESYRLYLMGINAKSDLTIQGYMKAVMLFYRSYMYDASFFLPLYELENLKNDIAVTISKLGLMRNMFNSFGNYDAHKVLIELLSENKITGIINACYKARAEYREKNSANFTRKEQIFSLSQHFNKYRDPRKDAINHPNDIEILFRAWEKVDKFDVNSDYKIKIKSIEKNYMPLKIIELFNEINGKFEQNKKVILGLQKEVGSIQKSNEYSNKQNLLSSRIKNVIDAEVEYFLSKTDGFEKMYPKSLYNLTYYEYFLRYSFKILEAKMYFVENVDYENSKEGVRFKTNLRHFYNAISEEAPLVRP
ncbi:MAG TPA: hypothetical protein PKJ16_13480 [Spirochaetota bacterium]|nr:hypothetical protein [Spirochaetota bacterium]HOS39264.1 hypothetical protein [Spirochaetota bacterium]HPU89682.1 hypothetical protein [Spirochaetota bacterium]